MPAIDQCLVRQTGKGVERGEHLLRGPLEEPPAAGAEQRVPAEERAVADIGDVPRSMAGHVLHLELEIETREMGAIPGRESCHFDGHALPARAEDRGPGRRDESRDAAHVIRVMVRRENRFEPQAVLCERVEHGFRVARIDDRDRARIARAANHPDIIVLESRNRPDVEHARVCGNRDPAANWPRRRGGGYAFAMAAHAPDLDAWLAGPLGAMLLEQEQAVVADSLECAFGLHCLQVGAWGEPDRFLALARTRCAALIAGHAAAGAALVAEPEALPLQSDSVDVMLLPHTLEFAPDPHEVLREAGRVLTGEGELVVLGFEPLGSWSFRHDFTRGGFPPGLCRTISAQRLTEWLKLVGFEVGAAERYLYVPPLAGLRTSKARGMLERIGRRAWPRFSGAYLLHARKRVHSMTPVRLRKRLRTAVIGGLVEPAARRVS